MTLVCISASVIYKKTLFTDMHTYVMCYVHEWLPICVYVFFICNQNFKMKLKYELNTNPKHNSPVNQLLCLNVLGCYGRKHAQNTSLRAELFGMYEQVRGYG